MTDAHVFDRAAEAWLCSDENGAVIDSNVAAERFVGVPREALVGRPVADVVAAGDRREAEARERVHAALRGGRATSFITSFRRPDGSATEAEVSVWPGDDGSRRVFHWLCRARTGDAAVADQVTAIARRLDESQRIAGVGSWEWILDADVVVWSAEQRRIFGVDQDVALTYESFAERLHPDDRASTEEAVRATVEAAGSLAFETRIVRPDGEVRWIAARGEVTEADERGEVRRMAGTVQDVTESKQAAASVAEADARFSAVFEHSPVGMLLWRPRGGAFRANPAAGAIVGGESSDLLGDQLEQYAHRDDRAAIRQLIDDIWRGARDVCALEIRLRQRDGGLAWVSLTAVLVASTEPYVVVQLQDVTAGKSAQRMLEVQAPRDPLTGLIRREQFSAYVDYALAAHDTGDVVGVLLVGLDGLRHVNDGLGREAGDAVLQEAARRLPGGVRRTDVVARLGGDEFAVVVQGLRSAEDAIAVATAARERLRSPFDIQGTKVHVSGSVGIVVTAGDGADSAMLLRRAGAAMSRAKALRTGWAVHRAEDHDVALDRLALGADLRTAVEDEALDVAYQPLVETRTGRVVSVEALARWHHRDRGDVPPDQFIPLAEQSGLIVPLTGVILGKAVKACAGWQADGHDLRVAVNLSVWALHSADITDMVSAALGKAGLPADKLVLEITESALADDTEQVADALRSLRAAGIRLAIDDFGTGYSAMSYLKRLPVEELKIDRAFVRDIASDSRDLSIVRSLVRLGQSLDLRVVAEGVEGKEVLDLLDNMACDLAQGYGIARPMPGDEIAGWLVAHEARVTHDARVNHEHRFTHASGRRPEELLVVDDSAPVRALVSDRASAAGWRVREAPSAEDAIAAVAVSAPDVMVLDHELPGLSGAQAIPILREKGFDGPILFFTRFLTEAMPGMRVPLDTWPVSKANLDGVLELLDAYRARTLD